MQQRKATGTISVELSHKLFTMDVFDRQKAGKLIGMHYMINFMLVPVLLMQVSIWIGLVAFFPALCFLLSNIFIHGTFLQPRTM